ncbi:DUF6065 family protein [Alsobacter sp. R-9]
MKLQAHVIDGHALDARPAPVEREWMDAPAGRHAYRCLPLVIANASGWELLNPSGFSALWGGDTAVGGVHVVPDDDAVPSLAIDHFGAGILTFRIPCLFRTPQGIDLMVTGPLNAAKDGIAALTGIVETDWAVATFTMNWRFTRPGVTVRFEAGEPFAHLMPLRRGLVEEMEPEWSFLSEDPVLAAGHAAWARSRREFNAGLLEPGRPADAPLWQRHYHQGRSPDGQATSDDHRTRVKARPFVRAPLAGGR